MSDCWTLSGNVPPLSRSEQGRLLGISDLVAAGEWGRPNTWAQPHPLKTLWRQLRRHLWGQLWGILAMITIEVESYQRRPLSRFGIGITVRRVRRMFECKHPQPKNGPESLVPKLNILDLANLAPSFAFKGILTRVMATPHRTLAAFCHSHLSVIRHFKARTPEFRPKQIPTITIIWLHIFLCCFPPSGTHILLLKCCLSKEPCEIFSPPATSCSRSPRLTSRSHRWHGGSPLGLGS